MDPEESGNGVSCDEERNLVEGLLIWMRESRRLAEALGSLGVSFHRPPSTASPPSPRIRTMDPVEVNGVRYSLLRESDRDEAARLLAEDFLPRAPLLDEIPFDDEDVRGFSRLSLDLAFEDEVSIAAREASTGELLGMALNAVHARGDRRFEERSEGLPPRMRRAKGAVSRFLADVPDLHERYGAERLLEIKILSVRSDRGTRGIGGNLVRFSLEVGRKRAGGMYVIASNARTVAICSKLDAELLSEFPAQEYLVDGKPFFSSRTHSFYILGMKL
ncbi:unnamed protein product [Darwinula stevensoni]|uniref:N-acetyltransferase domain-containing protein n=1 Tax=Darwinula stevensoni TaxID=69355 RepID=A0A7R8WY03_9CRUS|nr:unnamed protein product [Darwinula stevensoni]CAG0878828.1 unnamed protein product [Darwinula stevensoni]